MSSSFPDTRPVHTRGGTWLAAGSLCASCLVPAVAWSAETYWQPRIEARVEGHTNRDLRTGEEPGLDKEEMAGYLADVGLIWGINTPRSQTRIRPRLRFQDYPDRDDLQRFEQFFDLTSRYESLRSQLDLVASWSRRDAYTAELLEAGFDDFDPNDPVTDETGRLVIANTRTRAQVRPTYAYRLSERTGVGASVTAQTVNYESDEPLNQVDFNYGQIDTFWSYRLSEQTGISVGPYVSRYEARDDSVESDAYGLAVNWNRDWTESVRTELTLNAERTESDRIVPVVVEETETAWGAMLRLDARREVSSWRLNVGRRITPSGVGSKANSDELRVEYRRALSPRLFSTTAFRALRLRSQSDFTRDDDRDEARVELSLSWAMTPTWSISGGYSFMWRDFTEEPGDAHNNAIFLSLIFEGLGPPSAGLRRQRF